MRYLLREAGVRQGMPSLLGILALVTGLVGCSTVPITGRSQLSLIPAQQLLSLVTTSYQNFLKEVKLSQDEEKVKMVRAVGWRIAQAAEDFMRENKMAHRIKEFQWEFNVIEDDETINAFAMSGGKIAVYTGILPVTQDDNGLAAVLGHEIAHVLANHGGERISQLLLVQLGGMSLNMALKKQPDRTRNIAFIAYGLGSTVGLILPYSRTQEREADRIGLILMAKAGYDPRTVVDFWKRMNEKSKGTRMPEFLSTHPAPESRIKQIQAQVPEAMKYYNPH